MAARTPPRRRYGADEARAEIGALVERHGFVPGRDRLRELGFGRLATMVHRNRGIVGLLERLDLDPALAGPAAHAVHGKRIRYTDEMARVEADAVVAEVGYLPNAKRVHQLGYVGLSSYLHRNGGVCGVSERFGLPRNPSKSGRAAYPI